MTVRLTPIAATISCSVGSFAPGGSRAVAISSAIRSAISRVNRVGGGTGRSIPPWELRLGKRGPRHLSCYHINPLTRGSGEVNQTRRRYEGKGREHAQTGFAGRRRGIGAERGHGIARCLRRRQGRLEGVGCSSG